MASGWRTASEAETDGRDLDEDLPFGAFAPGLLQAALISLTRNSFLRRGLFRTPIARFVFAIRKPLDVMFRSCAYRLRGDNNLIEYGIMMVPGYNAADIDFLLGEAPEGANFVDVGSNIGLYSLPLAKGAEQNGKVVSIDASPMMARRLEWNAKASGLANVKVFHCAVSDADGYANLKIRKDDIAIVSIDETPEGAIPVRTLASVLAEAGLTAIRGLKIDIEGHEDRALVPFLDNAPETLLPQRIVIEHPMPDQDYPGCTAAFARHGYGLVGRTRNNSLYIRDKAKTQ